MGSIYTRVYAYGAYAMQRTIINSYAPSTRSVRRKFQLP